jgi:hypothetical protein
VIQRSAADVGVIMKAHTLGMIPRALGLVAAVLLLGCRASEDSTGGDETTDPDGEEPVCEPDPVPDFAEYCAECREQLVGCYEDPCGFESDPNDCVQTTLGFPVCECGASTETETFEDTCEPQPVPDEVDEYCEECRAAVVACFSDQCGFESDPNDCWNWTLGRPVCECVEGGTDTGSGSGGSSSGTSGG